MSPDVREYANHVPGALWLGDVPWQVYGRVLMPLTMPHVAIEVDRAQLRKAMAQTKALLASWTSHWDAYPDAEWWWVACDQAHYDVETLASSSGRQSVRKGLRNCRVAQLDAAEFVRHSYPLYRAALEGYGQQPPTGAQYAQNVEGLARYSGAEFWGAFHDERMAAFAICLVVDGAVDLSSAKSDPEAHRFEPNAALFYTLSKHYLDQGLTYVTNGARTLSHPTTINAFLEKLGFRKVYCRVEVELSPTARIVDASRLASWGHSVGFSRLFRERWSQLESFDKLLKIAHTFPPDR